MEMSCCRLFFVRFVRCELCAFFESALKFGSTFSLFFVCFFLQFAVEIDELICIGHEIGFVGKLRNQPFFLSVCHRLCIATRIKRMTFISHHTTKTPITNTQKKCSCILSLICKFTLVLQFRIHYNSRHLIYYTYISKFFLHFSALIVGELLILELVKYIIWSHFYVALLPLNPTSMKKIGFFVCL